MMQYQYACDGRTNQQPKVNRLTANWRGAQRIAVGDLCLAYLAPNGFYAAGRVITPRKPSNHVGSIALTLDEDRHEYLDGIVHYRDAEVFYEDFTDPFRYRFEVEGTGQIESYPYAQRVDVDKWQCARKASNGAYIGLRIDGLNDAVARCNRNKATEDPDDRLCCMRDVIIEVDSLFYHEIEEKLRSQVVSGG